MKRFLLLLIFCCIHLLVMAQWSVGVRGGASLTSISRSHANRIDETYSPRCGYDFRLVGSYSVNPWLSLRADLDIMQRNHHLQRHLNYISPVYTDHLNTYITLPLMADFSFGGQKLFGHFLVGAYCGYWLSQHVKGTSYGMTDYVVYFSDFDEPRTFTREDRRFDAGLAGGVALSYCLTSSLDINLDALFHYDLLSHHIGYNHLQDYRYLNTASLLLGITYNLNKKQQQ